jgi:hypothetical protein
VPLLDLPHDSFRQKVRRRNPTVFARKRDREVPYGMKGGEKNAYCEKERCEIR